MTAVRWVARQLQLQFLPGKLGRARRTGAIMTNDGGIAANDPYVARPRKSQKNHITKIEGYNGQIGYAPSGHPDGQKQDTWKNGTKRAGKRRANIKRLLGGVKMIVSSSSRRALLVEKRVDHLNVNLVLQNLRRTQNTSCGRPGIGTGTHSSRAVASAESLPCACSYRG